MAKQVNVKFPLLGKSVEIDENAKVSDACAMVGEPLNMVCGGKGKCKKCTVDVKIAGKTNTVLGCQEPVFEGLEVMITGQETNAQILTTNMIKDIKPDPSLKSFRIPKENLKSELGGSDWITLTNVIGLDLAKPSIDILRKLSQCFHHKDGIEVILYDNTVLDVMPMESNAPLYGLAFDAGTTSVVGYLYDLDTFKQIGMSSQLNKQTSLGGDVISRIDYSISNPDGLKRLNDLIMDTINEIITDICEKHHIDKNRIYQASFCGNSTMQHLLLGLSPEFLGKIPFTSTIQEVVTTKAKNTKVKINPDGAITVLPILGGHVGGDTAAVLLSLQNDSKNRLVIDLGTNGEVGVGSNYSFKVASMASGPALEGYGLEYGMRGTVGAIERVTVANGDLYYKVIGEVKPQGICGSGIIDLIAELLRHDVINNYGGFVEAEDINAPNLAKRLIKNENGKAFIVVYGEETEDGRPILLSQKDVRQIQLAKAAIFTGCIMLVEESGIKGEELEEILMAGAFGNYINIDKAQYIGMIPYFKDVPVYSIGNAAATGSQLFLLSKNEVEECNRLAENAMHIEIATNPKFTDNFMENTFMNKVERYK